MRVRSADDVLDENIEYIEIDGVDVPSHESILKAMEAYADQFRINSDDKSMPTIKELQPFLYWVFHRADTIWVSHILGRSETPIKDFYRAYKRRKDKNLFKELKSKIFKELKSKTLESKTESEA